MVARLVWLKWRLLVNGLRHDRQRLIGFPILVTFIAFGSFALAVRYMNAAESLSGDALIEFSMWCATLLWIGWATLPVLLFPLDESLSPAKFALQPLKPRTMVAGLAAAGLVTPPIVLPVVLIAANLGVFLDSSGIVVSLVASFVLIVMLVMSTQVFSAAVTMILRTRFGRDAIFLLIGALGFSVFFLQQRISTITGELGLAGAVLQYPLSGISWFLPPAAAQRAIIEVAQGNLAVAFGSLAVACLWILAIGWVWSRVVQRLITTPEAPMRESNTLSDGLTERSSLVNRFGGCCQGIAVLRT